MAKKQLTDDELKAIVAREIRLANGTERSELQQYRTLALEYFEGEMNDVPAEQGRSSVVSKDVSDAIGWILPSLMDVFAATEETAIVQPVGPEDVQFAEDATLALNHIFWKKNDGYNILYSAIHDALLMRDGIVKVWYEKEDQSEVTTHTSLSEEQLVMLLQPEPGEDADDIEVLTHTQNEDGTHDLKIKREKSDDCYRVDVIPPEDFFIDPDARSIDEARFLAHRTLKTRSELLEMEFDEEKVATIAKSSEMSTPEQSSRGDDNSGGEAAAADTSMELVDYYECQFKVDVDGDGMAETVIAHYAGRGDNGVLLDWEVWDDEPMFYAIPCKKIPHRFDSQSIADDTIEPQRVKTVLTRQALDNIYSANMPQKEVEAGSVLNEDELHSPTFGGVLVKKPGSAPIVPHVTPFVATAAFDAINYQDEVISRRTGVNRQSMALDADALQNQSATANQNAHDAGYAKIKLLARNMAEYGWSKVFRALLRLIIKHQSAPFYVRLTNGQWKQIDPKPWNLDMDVQIDIGLGTGSRDRDAMMIQQVINNLMMAGQTLMQAGLPMQAAKFIPHVLTAMKKGIRLTGLKAPDQYFPEITEEELMQAIQEAQQNAGQPDAKTQMDMQKAQAQMQLEQVKMQAARDKEMAQMQADIQVKQAEMQKNAELQQQKIAADAAQAEQDRELERQKMAMQYQIEMLKLEHDSALKALPHGGQVVKGKDGKSKVQASADVNFEMMMQAIAAIREMGTQQGEMLRQMAAHSAAPTEIVRDPATGKAIGARKVLQ